MESTAVNTDISENTIYSLLSPDGDCKAESVSELDEKKFVDMYRLLNLTRMWNDKAKSLQRQGRLGTLPSLKGQEAAGVGIAFAMQENDWFVPAFREAGALFHKGISLRDHFMFWGGDERGGKIPDGMKTTNISIIVGGHLPHAVGIAYAAKYKKEDSAVICVLGDGATSEGDFHESMNLAAVMQVPVVFVIQNNGWAISTPPHRQTATPTFAEKASSYAMDSVRVDGNDVLAVYRTIKDYADRARQESKPALIELLTYRIDDHTTADDATRYRSDEEVEYWRQRDPILRMKNFLQKAAQWDETKDETLLAECNAQVEAAAKEYLSVQSPDPRDMFQFMYSEIPWHLREQKQDLEFWLSKEGEE